jgi:hypothetical protein
MPVWERFAKGLDEPLASGVDLAQILYANRTASGLPFVACINLRHCLRQQASGRYDSTLELPLTHYLLHDVTVHRPRVYLQGRKRCVLREPIGTVHSEFDAMRAINNIFHRARHDRQCASAIGGPVDIAVIDALGRRWLQCKP